MKTLLTMVLCAGVALALSAANVQQQQQKPDPYRDAVKAYVEAAKLQMQAYRSELDAAAKLSAEEKERLAPAYLLVKRGEELIARLQSAPPEEFDRLKLAYEQNRSELDLALRNEPK